MTTTNLWPFDPLGAATGVVYGQVGGQQVGEAPGGVRELGRLFGVSKKVITRWRKVGLTDVEADVAAVALNLLPSDVWPAFGEAEVRAWLVAEDLLGRFGWAPELVALELGLPVDLLEVA